MKINWRVRLKNSTWLLTFCAAAIALIYQVLGLCGVVPPITQDTALGVISMVVNLLVMLGVVIDPTTSGVTDSARALDYTEPNGEK